MSTQEYYTTYHPHDDSFISDPDSLKFKFETGEDFQHNLIDCMFDFDAKDFMTKGITNQKKKKKKPKKYQTKPKDHNKIAKIKESREFRACY